MGEYIIWCVLVLVLAYISSYFFRNIKFRRSYLLFGFILLYIIGLITINSIFLTFIVFTIATFGFSFKRAKSTGNPIETDVVEHSPTYVDSADDRPDFKENRWNVKSHKDNKYVRSDGYKQSNVYSYTANSLIDNSDDDEYERDRFEYDYAPDSFDTDYDKGYDYDSDRYDSGDSGSGFDSSDW